jgi:Phage gp6-like head-tail connector protein
MTTTWPSLKEVRALLRLQPDPTEDAVIQTALSAAVDFGMRRFGYVTLYDTDTGIITRVYRYPPDSDQVPDTGHEACLLHAARLYRRRDSVDGTISWGDMGTVRIGRVDPDVMGLYDSVAPWGFA